MEYNNTLKVLAVKWPVENGRLPDDTNTKNWVRRKVIEKDGKKLFWDLALEDKSKKAILLIDMACPNEYNEIPKRGKTIRNHNQLCFELRKRQEGYTVKVIRTIVGCLGGGMKELKESIIQIFKYDNNEILEKCKRLYYGKANP